MTAHCNPKQMPRNGFNCVRAHSIAVILPSTPREPKPPGTRTPLKEKKNLNRTNTSRFLLCTAQLLPSFVIFYWIIFLRISFKISCINKLYAKKMTRKSWIFVRQSTDFLRELLISDYKIELHESMLSKLMHRHLPCLCICLPRQC